jgi:hypothetical protein
VSAAASVEPEEGDGLIFQWYRRTPSRWRLGLMLGLSLLAHAAGFYLLQVAYTPTGSLLPPPAQVLLVPPGSAESASLEHWIDMADPSLLTQPREMTAEQVLASIPFRYVPSYANVLQNFKPLPAPAPTDAPATTRRPGPVPAGLLPPLSAPVAAGAHSSTGQATPASRTRVVLSAEIAALAAPELPPVPPPANRSAQPLERTVFLVGVAPGGGAAWIFEQASSGDAAGNGADAAARDYLARLRFSAPAGVAVPTWGWATFYWGRDAYP